jgi:hypothetical protein
MHRGHDHDHHNGHGGAPGAGHNRAQPKAAIQWQTPHLPHHHGEHEDEPGERDLDLVETAFAEGFAAAEDPTSFLRLANIPFEGETADGVRLVLLRVEGETVTDVGSVMPHLGGDTFRYDPLPASMVTRRQRLRFIYRDGEGTRALAFAEARALHTVSSPINSA